MLRRQTASPASNPHLFPSLLFSVLLKSHQVRFLTPPSPIFILHQLQAAGQLAHSMACRRCIRCSVNQSIRTKIFRIARKRVVGSWNTNLLSPESSLWNGIHCKCVHTHPVYLNLWKWSWTKQVFHCIGPWACPPGNKPFSMGTISHTC